MNNPTSPTLEVKTKVEVDKTMKLIDMNGKKISFRSECIVKPNNPNDKFYIAIVNQNDLDSGNINFEVLDREYKRRITYESEDGQHLNHYIVMKKMPNNSTEAPILCDVIVRLTELETKEPEPIYSKIEYKEEEKEEIKEKLLELSNSSEYKEKEIEHKLEKDESKFNYRNIGFFCIIVFVLYILIRKK
jgi:acetyl/propionyl-CoA carboxylase alpha subunit